MRDPDVVLILRREIVLEPEPETPGDVGRRWLEIRIPLVGATEYRAERRLPHAEPESYSVSAETFRDLMTLAGLR